MTNYRPAGQRLDYAVRKLDDRGSARARLEQAWMQLTLLGQVGIFIPDEIRAEVEEMHASVAANALPGRVNALGRAISSMSDEECETWIARIRHWAEVVEASTVATL